MIVTDSRDIFSGAEGLDAAAWPDWPGWPEAFEETSVDMGVPSGSKNEVGARASSLQIPTLYRQQSFLRTGFFFLRA
jgi:hypothetical protein